MSRRALVALAVLGLVAVAAVAVLDGIRVASEQSRNEGGWLTGWGPLIGTTVALLLAMPALLGLLGAALVARTPRVAGVLLLVGGIGGLVVGVLSLLGSVGWGLVTLPVAVVCTFAFAELSRAPRPAPGVEEI
jgi:hypothetical protein